FIDNRRAKTIMIVAESFKSLGERSYAQVRTSADHKTGWLAPRVGVDNFDAWRPGGAHFRSLPHSRQPAFLPAAQKCLDTKSKYQFNPVLAGEELGTTVEATGVSL